APVAGLRPLVALRWVAAKVPKPTRRTSSPSLSAEVMVSKTASTAAAAWALVRSAFSATAALRSFLFIAFPHNEYAHPFGRAEAASPFYDSGAKARKTAGFPAISLANWGKYRPRLRLWQNTDASDCAKQRRHRPAPNRHASAKKRTAPDEDAVPNWLAGAFQCSIEP